MTIWPDKVKNKLDSSKNFIFDLLNKSCHKDTSIQPVHILLLSENAKYGDKIHMELPRMPHHLPKMTKFQSQNLVQVQYSNQIQLAKHSPKIG